jgi:exo-1,4-beta-D-glucosaminidase
MGYTACSCEVGTTDGFPGGEVESMSKFAGPLMVFLAMTCAAGRLGGEASPNMVELRSGWQLEPARDVSNDGAVVSQASFEARGWRSILRMPATVLQALIDSGVYKDVYYGMNLKTRVPQDLRKQDWWYRTRFTAPSREVFLVPRVPGLSSTYFVR